MPGAYTPPSDGHSGGSGGEHPAGHGGEATAAERVSHDREEEPRERIAVGQGGERPIDAALEFVPGDRGEVNGERGHHQLR